MIRVLITTLLILKITIQVSSAQTSQGSVATLGSVDWEKRGDIVERIPTLAIKTNLLFDFMAMVNIEFEIPMYSHWSVCAEIIFPWWYNPSRQRAIEILSGEIQGRYWFDYHSENYTLDGWFVGGYLTGGYYDLESKWRGAQGEMWGGGLSGGYAHGVWRNLRVEYALGLGVIHTTYDKYNALYDCQSTLRLLRYAQGRYNYWGITKVEISAVWIFNRIKREAK